MTEEMGERAPDFCDEGWIRARTDLATGTVAVPVADLVRFLREHAALKKELARVQDQYNNKLWERG